MHEMQTIVTDDHGVCLSMAQFGGVGSMCRAMQPLPNHFSLCLLVYHILQRKKNN